MKRKIFGIALIGTLLLFVYTMVAEYHQESTPVFRGANDFTTAVNTVRAGRDLEPVFDSAELSKLADRKCFDMVQRHYIGHVDPDGKMIWDYAPHGYKYGENLAGSYLSSYDVVQAWEKSPEHLENIIDPQFHSVGHATCYDGKQYLVVEVFKS